MKKHFIFLFYFLPVHTYLSRTVLLLTCTQCIDKFRCFSRTLSHTHMLSLSCLVFRQRSDLNCAISLAKWIIHALNLEERVVNVVSSVLSVPVEDWTELVRKASA